MAGMTAHKHVDFQKKGGLQRMTKLYLTEEKCFICCLCGERTFGYGNNPAPISEGGRCCENCNLNKVVPARFAEEWI